MPNSFREQGFTHILVILGFSGVTLLFASSLIPVTKQYNDGKSSVAGVYLAKGDSSESGDSGSHDSESSSGKSSDSGSDSKLKSDDTKTTEDKKVEIKIETKNKEEEKKKVEVKKIKDSQRLEVKTNQEKIKSEIRQGNLRVKFEIENGKVKVETKVKSANKVETELENEAENEAVKEVEEELEKADIKVATAPGQIALVNKKMGALISFPLSVDPTTKQLTVTTPAGTKVVTVLPEEAMNNMLAAHIMDNITNEKVSNSLASIPGLVKLELKNGVLGYQVKGVKTHKLLGFIPIKTEVETFVSAENGQVVESNQSLLGRILNRIAP